MESFVFPDEIKTKLMKKSKLKNIFTSPKIIGKCSKLYVFSLKRSEKQSNKKYFLEAHFSVKQHYSITNEGFFVSKDLFVSYTLQPHNLMDQDVLQLKWTVRHSGLS